MRTKTIEVMSFVSRDLYCVTTAYGMHIEICCLMADELYYIETVIDK